MKNYFILSCLILVATASFAQKKKKRSKSSGKITSVQLYEGSARTAEEIVRLRCESQGSKYAYFINVNDEEIPNRSLMTGPNDISLLPGEHTIQMRFVAKGEIAIPIEPFDKFRFEAGKTYHVKFEYTAGKGSYLDAASKTKIKLWIEEEGHDGVLLEKTVDGFGRSSQE